MLSSCSWCGKREAGGLVWNVCLAVSPLKACTSKPRPCHGHCWVLYFWCHWTSLNSQRVVQAPIAVSEAGMGAQQKSWELVQSASSQCCLRTATICPFSPNDSFVLTRQLSVVSSEGGECPNKMSTKRRVCEKKPAEPPLPRKNPNEKLIQAETTETGMVLCDSPSLFLLFYCLKKEFLFLHLFQFC